ncbi:hypothetical protein [Atopomonas hussainii]|uniref:hypothetical protein n=1 Tax=Atopomonas hussainii TaxID=1429083 RepID=UPI0009441522|nr:hypothetical protein [Atopomonas hussainii]
MKFKIVADDLPPELKIQRLTHNQIERESKNEKSGFELENLIAGLVFLAFAFFSGILSHYIPSDALPELSNAKLQWINHLPIMSIASFAGYILTGILTLIGGALTFGAIFGNFEFPRSKKFRLPNEFAIGSYGIRQIAFEDSIIVE